MSITATQRALILESLAVGVGLERACRAAGVGVGRVRAAMASCSLA